MDSSDERLCFVQTDFINPHKNETPSWKPGVSNYYEYTSPIISRSPYRASICDAVQPKLRVHRDGRPSYRDLTGRWVRYTTKFRRKSFTGCVNHSAAVFF